MCVEEFGLMTRIENRGLSIEAAMVELVDREL